MGGFSWEGTGDAVTVVALGLPTPALLPALPAVQHLARDADLDTLTSVVQERLTHAEAVLVVHPAWAPEPARARLRTVRSLLGTTRVLAHETPLPPTAGGVLACLAGTLGAQLATAGALVGALAVVEQRIQVVTWLGTVARLERPSPSLLQHARSAVTRAPFAVVHAEGVEEVRRVRRGECDLGLKPPEGTVAVHVADADGDAVWVGQVIDGWVPRARIQCHAEPAEADAFWGRRGWTEAVVYPCDVDELVRLAGEQAPVMRCRWCAETVPRRGEHCPYCRVELMPSVGRGVPA